MDGLEGEFFSFSSSFSSFFFLSSFSFLFLFLKCAGKVAGLRTREERRRNFQGSEIFLNLFRLPGP